MSVDPPTSPVSFTFDVDAEEVWLGEYPDSAQRPVTLSQGTYGPRVGVPQILRLLNEYRVTGSFFVPGRTAQRYPSTVEAILSAGHEVAHHGHTHRAPAILTYEEEVEEFTNSIAALREFGVEPHGYRAPSWDFSTHTLGLVEEYGFAYSSNFMADIRPYRHEDHDVIELPVHWNLDDAAHFWFSGYNWDKKIATNSEAGEIFEAEERGIAALGGCVIYTFHPQIIGRPGRLALLEATIIRVLSNPQLRVMTTEAIAHSFKGIKP